MGFFDSLMQNPTGSGIYGNTGPRNMSNDIGLALSARKKVQDEEENRGYRQANFAADLSNRQNRMNAIYGTNPMASGGPGSVTGITNPIGGLNSIFKEDPDRITPQQREAFSIKREDLANDREKIKATTALAGSRLGLDREKYDLDVQKNANIYETKNADLQRKHDEAQARLAQADKALTQRKNDADAQLNWHKAKAEADDARHKLEIAQRDRQIDDLSKYRDASLAEKAKSREQGAESTTTAERDSEGNVVKTKTKKGSEFNANDPFGIR
jgi:hypothetical protein